MTKAVEFEKTNDNNFTGNLISVSYPRYRLRIVYKYNIMGRHELQGDTVVAHMDITLNYMPFNGLSMMSTTMGINHIIKDLYYDIDNNMFIDSTEFHDNDAIRYNYTNCTHVINMISRLKKHISTNWDISIETMSSPDNMSLRDIIEILTK